MITPPYLKKGDKIGIVSTARKISSEELYLSIETFKQWGLEVVLGENIYNVENQFAGSDQERTVDMQTLLNDPTISAIICSRGGYGTVKIIDHLDFSKFIKAPKWIIGYSDITVLHSHIHANYGIETLHATMPINFNKDEESVETLRKALFGELHSYQVNYHPLNKPGQTSGILIGGNLSVIFSLIGSKSDIDSSGKILLIEDLDEYLYHIDRMMMNLKRSGKLNNLAGLIIGGMTEMRDNAVPYGKSAEKIIADSVAEYNYPVCFDFPSGHGNKNFSLYMGRNILLNVSDKTGLSFE